MGKLDRTISPNYHGKRRMRSSGLYLRQTISEKGSATKACLISIA